VRTFIALVPPKDVREALAEAAHESLGSVRGLRLYPAEDLHLTLAFLGPVDAHGLGRLAAALDRAAAGTGAVELLATHTGAFPSRSRPRILWAGLESAETLRPLFDASVAASRAAGLEPADAGREPWTPHITLARARAPSVELPAEFVELSLDLEWTAREVAVCQSDLRAGAALRYPVVHRVEL
jgi:2'-5' RNA ligase